MTEAEDKTAALLAALWLKNRPIVDERMAVLEGAAAAACTGSLAEAQRKEAQSAAHKLAGALGMYGYDEGTRIARKLEMLLDEAAPDATTLAGLIAELRNAVLSKG
jgi:HPt (histidine-containing phosphotransfer) domain-containing protein